MIEPPLFAQAELPFQLRPYQAEAVNVFLQRRHGTIIMPTGVGKTAIAIEAIRRLQTRTAIIVPTESLLHQWVQKLKEANIHAGVFYGKEKRHGAVTVFIINSASTHLNALRPYGLIVNDEVHHTSAIEFSRLLPLFQQKPYVLGLTSHLARSDGRENLIKKVAPVIYGMPIAKAMNKQYISQLQIFPVKAAMTLWEQSKIRRVHEHDPPSLFQIGTVNPARLSKMEQWVSYSMSCRDGSQKNVLSNVMDKQHKVYQISNLYPQERILVFCESIASANAIYKHFLQHGKPAGIYHSKIGDDAKHRMLQQWKNNEFKLLISVRALDEGIDVPECRVAVIVASGSSHRQWIQRNGRILRKRLNNSAGLLFITYCTGTIEAKYAQKIKWIIENE